MKTFKLRALVVASALALFSVSQPVTAAPSELDPRMAPESLMHSGGLMEKKIASRERCRKDGLCGNFVVPGESGARRAGPRAATCTNGKAGEYPCTNVDMLDMLTHNEMQSLKANGGGEGNDCWGWTSSTGREFGLVGQIDGTAFVEINASTGAMKFLGRLPTATTAAIWRDIKVVGNYAFVVSEARNHGLQVFDLRRLLNVSSPQTFKADALFTGFGNAHNLVNSPDSNYIIAVGQNTCSSGLYFIDISNPLAPKAGGCYGGDGYTHDAQCVRYNGPDTAYKGREICFAFNEDSLTIVDATDKRSPKQLSRTTYRGSAYTHQGWVTDGTHSYIVMDDELDEENGTVTAADGHTRTYLWNVKKLTQPVLEGNYRSPVTSIDHNQYVINGFSYQANYCSGLRIVDVRGVASGGGIASMKEVANFDVRPEDDAVDFFGSWNAYTFPSGKVLVNSIERGAFVVKPRF